MNFNRLLYYLILLPLSRLPFSILYALSDGLFVLLYYIVGYRKKVVTENLQKSFPEKTKKEITIIQKRFYRHFCDLVVESIKAFSISEKELNKRIYAVNSELLQHYFDKGKNLILVTSHYGNWEWGAMAFPKQSRHQAVAIYLPLNNRFLNEKFKKSRSRFGTHLISVKQVPRFFSKNGRVVERRNEKNETFLSEQDSNLPSFQSLFTCSFLSDQSPSNPDAAYWMEFLNQHTGVLQGPEHYSKKFNLPLVYGYIQKIKRGYYEIKYSLVTDEPLKMNDGEITKKFTELTETCIKNQPEYWLWSHRRWKHKR